MLKKIPVAQLAVGMHLHKLEGSWMSHPFWKANFVIDGTAQLLRVRECGVAECWIDDALGLDVCPVSGSAAPAPAAAAAPAAPMAATRPGPAPRVERSMVAELREASAICARGREAVTALFNEARLGRAVDASSCLPLVSEITASVGRNAGALVSLARLKRRDDYSYMHSVAVCALMVALARQLGLSDDDCREAGTAGLLHDIGKAVMPLHILNKPARLSDEEFAIIRTHPQRGHALLMDGQGASPVTLDVVLHHHERADGTGYPHRLNGEALSQFARMGSICDVYDAISSNRPYKQGWDPAESVAQMAGWKGQFDTRLFAAFVQSLGIYPIGSLVKLASERLAVVAAQNAEKLTAPVVMVFYSKRSQMRIPPLRLDLARAGCSDRIVAREADAAGQFANLDELWADPDVLRHHPH